MPPGIVPCGPRGPCDAPESQSHLRLLLPTLLSTTTDCPYSFYTHLGPAWPIVCIHTSRARLLPHRLAFFQYHKPRKAFQPTAMPTWCASLPYALLVLAYPFAPNRNTLNNVVETEQARLCLVPRFQKRCAFGLIGLLWPAMFKVPTAVFPLPRPR